MDLSGLKVESFQCRNHPEREGVGICVACRRVFCVECSTKIDGVNHCRECLAKRQKTATATGARAGGFLTRTLDLLAAIGVGLASVALVTAMLMALGESLVGGTRRGANRGHMESVARALRSYKHDVGAFPDETEGLGALRVEPESAAPGAWRGPYLDSTFERYGKVIDGYGQPVHYRAPALVTDPCVIGSGGANRIFETDIATVAPLKFSPGGEGAGEGDDLILFVE